MDWIRSILTMAGAAFDHAGAGFAAIPLAFALGLLSAIASACCTLPVMGIIVGYAGAREACSRRERLLAAGAFFLGAVLALVILGGVAAVIGQVAQSSLGRYWKLFAGLVAIFLGLGAMNLLPFRLSRARQPNGVARKSGVLSALLFGLVGGGAVTVCSLACNPGIFIILGAAVLQGMTLWLLAILVAFALGFALPLGALMLGVTSGTAFAKLKGLETVIRVLAGVLLVSVGFYFLWTF